MAAVARPPAGRRRDRVFADTNVFLRFLTGDDPEKAGRCRALFERAGRGLVDLHISELVLAELAWTLRSYYGQRREEIAAILSQILEMRALRVPHRAVLHEAVALFGRHNVDFIDTYHAAAMRRRGIERICSYDEDFDRLGVRREEP